MIAIIRDAVLNVCLVSPRALRMAGENPEQLFHKMIFHKAIAGKTRRA